MALERLWRGTPLGALHVRLHRHKEQTRVYIALDTRQAPALRRISAHVVQGQPRARELPVLTQSLLTVLYAIAAQTKLLNEDVAAWRAPATPRESGTPRPSIVVRFTPSPRSGSYAAAMVGGT